MSRVIPENRVEQSRLSEVDFSNLGFGRVFSDHMLYAENIDGEWVDVQIKPYGPLSLDPSTSVLHYSQTVFEGLKAFKRENDDIVLIRPWENFARINRSAERMCMPAIPEDIFLDGLYQLLRLDRDWIPYFNGVDSLYIRPIYFGADNYVGVKPANRYIFIIFTGPVSSYYSGAVKVKIEQEYSRAFPGGTGNIKAGANYGVSLYPAKQAQVSGYHQLIWTDGLTHTKLEESGTMNLMIVRNGRIVTPRLTGTILPGITRQLFLDLASSWELEAEEDEITVTDLIEGISNGSITEAFGVGTAAVTTPIEVINFDGNDYQLPEVAVVSQKLFDSVTKVVQKYSDPNDSILQIIR